MPTGGSRSLPIVAHEKNIPTITVITVVRNNKDLLEQTILSIVNQSYKNLEYIIIDGASTDGTLDVIKKYDDKISFWLSEPDDGIYAAMNKGIDKATGEWVNFMNCGDVFYNADVIHEIFHQPRDADVIFGDTNFVFDTGTLTVKGNRPNPQKSWMTFCHQAAFTRLCCLQRFHFDTRYSVSADSCLFYLLDKNSYTFSYVPILICSFEASEGFSSKNILRAYYETADFTGKNKSACWKLVSILMYVRFSLVAIIKKILPRKLLSCYRRYYYISRKTNYCI
jgi:glycosyltransferase involved in cell wall biosynthesis